MTVFWMSATATVMNALFVGDIPAARPTGAPPLVATSVHLPNTEWPTDFFLTREDFVASSASARLYN